MSSSYAQQHHYGELPEYRASEGIVSIIPFKGSVKNIIQDYEGSLRSSLTYVGAKTLVEFPNKVKFYKVRRQLNRMVGNKEIE